MYPWEGWKRVSPESRGSLNQRHQRGERGLERRCSAPHPDGSGEEGAVCGAHGSPAACVARPRMSEGSVLITQNAMWEATPPEPVSKAISLAAAYANLAELGSKQARRFLPRRLEEAPASGRAANPSRGRSRGYKRTFVRSRCCD